MMSIKRLIAGVALMCFAAGVAVSEIEWNYDYLKAISDYLASECRNSRRIADFAEENGRRPRVILGEIINRSYDVIDTSTLARQFQNALINSGVLDFVSDSSERLALRAEKRDQDYHASIDTAKAIDNENAADFMLRGEIHFISQDKKKATYSIVVQFHDIERNTIMFSKEFPMYATIEKPQGKTDRTPVGEVGLSHYQSFAFAIPLVNRSFDSEDDAECDFEATTFGIDYSLFNVNNENKLAILTKIGAAAGNGKISAKYKSNSEITLDDITTYAFYGRLGFGRAFSSPYGTVVFIPTLGVGVFYEDLSAEYESDFYSSSKEFTGYNLTLDLSINTFLAIMLTDKWGISFSFEISMSPWGMGSFTEMGDYNTNFGSFNFMPAFGVCYRF